MYFRPLSLAFVHLKKVAADEEGPSRGSSAEKGGRVEYLPPRSRLAVSDSDGLEGGPARMTQLSILGEDGVTVVYPREGQATGEDDAAVVYPRPTLDDDLDDDDDLRGGRCTM